MPAVLATMCLVLGLWPLVARGQQAPGPLVAHAAASAATADGLQQALTATPGDAARGQVIVANRSLSQCLLCHQAPLPHPHLQGDLATDLAGAGSRWSAAQLRLRIVNPKRLNPESLMPAYHPNGEERAKLQRVADAWHHRPILNAQQVEDVVAYLEGLK